MILFAAIALSIIVGLLRGGRLNHLANVSFAYGWVALLALAVQVAVVYLPLPGGGAPWGLGALLLVGSYMLLVFVVAANRRLPGLLLIGVGLGLNLLVMLANGGYMPVTLEALKRAGVSHLALANTEGARIVAGKDILLSRESARLWVLSDIFVVPSPVGVVVSLGDLFLALGVFVLFQRAMRPRLGDSKGVVDEVV